MLNLCEINDSYVNKELKNLTGAEFKALLKVSWGFARIHFGAPFGVCGTASTDHRFHTTSMNRINSKLRTSLA